MSKLMNYRVVRRHEGDRMYEEGQTRTARSDDVKHLVPHVLEEIGPAAFGGNGDHDDNGETGGAAPAAEKAEPAPLNKAEPAPANKAASPRKSKSK
ncbi:MAG: hypothetical protein JWQ89_2259 [Devosia sp.]|uniref:hypothetical protein n=1 Tax=Devosia sp. TaxID=1871048 RepID=UPI00262B5B30|nr:hypothetical protein [Devosia sp.]MDB5540532.1 hypothetical protein [Devosia sp.]